MCSIVNIGDREKDINTPKFDDEKDFIDGIKSGKYNIFNLPKNLFQFNFFTIMFLVSEYFGLPSDFVKGSFEYKTAIKMKNSVSIFSGAKTFQHVLELSNSVFLDGQVLPINEFNKIARKINDKYNINYLATEQQAAFRQSESADTWRQIQEDKNVFPLLKYSTAGDERVRNDHKRLDNIIKPIDDPFWSTWFPPNDWNCRCIVTQLESGSITKKVFGKNDSDVFSGNTGKDGLIFPKTHPYNKVPKEFKQAKKNNFGFKTPTDNDIKNKKNGSS